ncbi:MAG: 2-C-methyl-D-erythritol 2,4-cyclodiphosphate synthase [Candidatus Accumulibacter sp.]|jgi:2-C-methyl-D-erythritol 2,4-cyclodiphosphate synthase|nr:2-C-methyl-D-erythritol 2,4-cyclodiphosphate synthase [Accumulibacter sp.]
MIRIGQGSDIHALASGRRLIIGGVEIPYEFGLLGHSDADVLLHAIIDALLGAAGMGDIGRLFPDTDARYRDVDSRVLLRAVGERLAEAGWCVVNVDATIHAERPKMAPHIPRMVAVIADDLGIDVARVNVKAKTAEKLGFVGREEGLSADAVVLIGQKAELSAKMCLKLRGAGE